VVFAPILHEKFQRYTMVGKSINYNPVQLVPAENEQLPSEILKLINSLCDTEEIPRHLKEPALVSVYQDIHRVRYAVTCGILETRNC